MTYLRGSCAGLEYIEVRPDGTDDRLPLVIGLHGRGTSAEDMAGLAEAVDSTGYLYVLPNGPVPLDMGPWGNGYAWLDSGPARGPSVVRARELVQGLLTEMMERHRVGPDRTAIIGFSQGATLALDVGLRWPSPLGAVVAMSGRLPDAPDFSQVLARASRRPVLIVHGTHDDMIPVEKAREARDALDGAGVAPTYHEFSIGHQATEESLDVVRCFLRSALCREA